MTTIGVGDFAKRLGLHPWQFDRARAVGLVPAQDRSKGWSAEVVEQTERNTSAIWAAVGEVQDLGAWRAAEYLTVKFDMPVNPWAVTELGEMGKLATAGNFKGHTLYSGKALEAFNDLDALREAERQGELFTADHAALRLGIRRVDFDHLDRAGLIEYYSVGRGQWRSFVRLYRARDLDALAASDVVDWAAVRATPKGRPSLLAFLPDASKETTR